MAHSFEVYIDESGDQGLSFPNPDCSRWFMISAVIALRVQAPSLTDLVKAAKAEIDWPYRKALHFKDVKCLKRERLLRVLTSDKKLFRVITVLVHKPSLSAPERFREENRMYFYFTRYLLERASWLCRDSKEHSAKRYGDGTAKVIFSSMNEISRERIGTYFAQSLLPLGTSIDWNVIRPNQFESLSAGKSAGLQIADSVAGGFYCTDHHCQRKRTHQWVEMWKPLIFRSSIGKYRGYGVKIFPNETQKQIAHGTLCPWAIELFPE